MARLFQFLLAATVFVASALNAQTNEQLSSSREPKRLESGKLDIQALAESYKLPVRILEPRVDPDALELLLLPLTEPELARAAAAWQQIVKNQTQAVVDATLRAAEMEGETGQLFREKIAALVDERRHLFENFAIVVNDWQKKGGDPDQIADYWAYRSSIYIDEIRKADVQTLKERVLKWAQARDGGIEFAIDTSVVVVAFLALIVVARLIRRLVKKWLSRVKGLSAILQGFLGSVFYWLTLSIGLMLVFSMLGVDITPLFALLGGATFILAFAMQETISNFFSGLMIMLNRPFDEGDYVDLEGVAEGTVKQTNLITTTIATIDNKIVVTPNNRVWNSVITNVTASHTRRVDMVFGIDYSDDVARALEILEDLASNHPLALKTPAPVVCVGALADSSVNLLCRPWSKTEDYWDLFWDMQRKVKERFDSEGITIPFPQRTVHIEKSTRVEADHKEQA